MEDRIKQDMENFDKGRKKCKTRARVLDQRELTPGIFDMQLKTDLAAEALPGQFIGVYTKDKSALLPRPISICEADAGNHVLRIVYRVAGQGTAEFSSYKAKDEVEILGVLGNGFPVSAGKDSKKVFLMGGGIGIPPVLGLAKALAEQKNGMDVHVILGYRDQAMFLKDEFEQYGTVHIATEDGSFGTKGNVMDAIKEQGLSAELIYACGPMPMLRAIKTYAGQNGIPAYISLEERMACGVGACLGCVVKTKEVDHHSHVNNARICTDGPVFEAKEVEI